MFKERLNYQGDLTPILKNACRAYNLGDLKKFNLIETGYEDFNLKLETSVGKYLVKIFAKFRTVSEIERLVSVLEKINDTDISYPKLHKTSAGPIYFESNIYMVFMDYIKGKTFYDMKTTPSGDDLVEIVRQATKINKIRYDNLSYLSDSWSVQNIESTYAQIGKNITDKLALDFVRNSIDKWKQIPLDKLPVALVHGDIITTNVIKAYDNKIYIIDYSVANLYPRIQEIAVMTSNLLAGNGKSLMENRDMITNIYNQFIPLTDNEHKYLEPFIMAETSAIYMGAIREKVLNNNNSDETNYWINLCYQDMKSYQKK